MEAIPRIKPFDRVLLLARRNSIIITTNLFLLTCFNIFAEEEKAIQTYYPVEISQKSPSPSPVVIESEINALKKFIQNADYFTRLIAYKAVKENNLFACDVSGEPNVCRSVTKKLLDMRRWAEGKCDSIENRDIRTYDFCGRFKRGDCDTLSGWQKDACNAFFREDFSLLTQAQNAQKKSERDSDDVLLEKFSVFNGFKNYNSKLSCDKYGLQLPLPKKFICEVMFTTQDVAEILDKISLDVALFTISKKYGKIDLCDRIKDSDIRKRCRDKTIAKVW